MTDNPEQIGQLLDTIFRYGPVWVYLAILVACFIENVFPPFPGDSFIAVAGALSAAGRLSLVLSFALVVIGGMSSVMLMYAVGRRYGRDYFMKKDFKYFSAEDIRSFERGLGRWGAFLMVFSRFVVGFRSAIALGAGIADYPTTRMVVYSTVSYILFTGLIFYLAAVLVQNLGHIRHYFETYNTIVWPIVVIAAAALIVWKIMKVRARNK